MAKDIFDYVTEGNIEEVEAWLNDEENDIDEETEDGDTPLHLAAEHNHTEIVQLLLNKGANVDAQNQSLNTPLHLAAAGYHIESVELLLSKNANALIDNNDNTTPYEYAIKYARDNLKIVSLFFNTIGHITNGLQDTIIHSAIIFGNSNAVLDEPQFLTATIHAKNENGDTPLHLAAECGDTTKAKLLLKKEQTSVLKMRMAIPLCI